MENVCLCIDLEVFHLGGRFVCREMRYCDWTRRESGVKHFYLPLHYRDLTDREKTTVRWVIRNVHGLTFQPPSTADAYIHPLLDRYVRALYDRFSHGCTGYGGVQRGACGKKSLGRTRDCSLRSGSLRMSPVSKDETVGSRGRVRFSRGSPSSPLSPGGMSSFRGLDARPMRFNVTDHLPISLVGPRPLRATRGIKASAPLSPKTTLRTMASAMEMPALNDITIVNGQHQRATAIGKESHEPDLGRIFATERLQCRPRLRRVRRRFLRAKPYPNERRYGMDGGICQTVRTSHLCLRSHRTTMVSVQHPYQNVSSHGRRPFPPLVQEECDRGRSHR